METKTRSYNKYYRLKNAQRERDRVYMYNRIGRNLEADVIMVRKLNTYLKRDLYLHGKISAGEYRI